MIIIEYVVGNSKPPKVRYTDGDETPRNMELVDEKLLRLLFNIDTDETWQKFFAPQFKLVKTETLDKYDRTRYFEVVGK